jgi:hypothetical protein
MGKQRQERASHECTCMACREHPRGEVAKEHQAINRVLATLDEKSRRRFVGLLALQWGRGSIALLNQVTGLSRPTIRRGREEVSRVEKSALQGRLRQAGAGRPAVEKNSRDC